MPAVVNHEERRQQIARIAADLISSVGLDAMTMREIAAAAGFSTTIVTHYFANKRELMLYTYRASVAHAQARVDAVIARDACDLPASIEALLPFDESSLKDWKVFLAFWQIAQVDPDFAAEQRAQAAQRRQHPAPGAHGAGRGGARAERGGRGRHLAAAAGVHRRPRRAGGVRHGGLVAASPAGLSQIRIAPAGWRRIVNFKRGDTQ